MTNKQQTYYAILEVNNLADGLEKPWTWDIRIKTAPPERPIYTTVDGPKRKTGFVVGSMASRAEALDLTYRLAEGLIETFPNSAGTWPTE